MRTKIEIEWWHDESNDVEERHQYDLLEYALSVIKIRALDGYVSGELSKEIEGIYYNGIWELKYL